MRKRIISMFIAATMLLSTTACGNDGNTKNENGYTTDELTVNIWDNNQVEGLQ